MKKLVIVGGGFAGSYCARKLESHFDTTLIDSKNFFEFTPSVLRTLVEPEHAHKIEVKHTYYLKKSHFIHGSVTSLGVLPTGRLFVQVGSEKVQGDYVIIATGSHYATPIKNERVVLANRSRELSQYATRLSEVDSVLIIGGGVVGCELAAEIVCAFPHKRVVLVHSGKELCERLPERARKYITSFLLKRGVEVVFGERVMDSSKNVFSTTSGRSFTSDLVFWCTGIAASSEFVVGSTGFSSCVVSAGAIDVMPTLQLKTYPSCFVAGDVTAIVEEKLAQSAEAQAQIVVANILAREKGKKLVEYIPVSRTMVISLGKWDGVIVSGSLVWCGVIAGLLKSVVEWFEMKKLKGLV